MFYTGINLIPNSERDSVIDDILGNGGFHIFGEQGISTLISSVATWILVLVTLTMFLCILWSGYQWLVSGGDKGKLQGVRKRMTNCLIGLTIVFLSWALILIVQYFFGITKPGGGEVFIPPTSAPTPTTTITPTLGASPTTTPTASPTLRPSPTTIPTAEWIQFVPPINNTNISCNTLCQNIGSTCVDRGCASTRSPYSLSAEQHVNTGGGWGLAFFCSSTIPRASAVSGDCCCSSQ